MQYTITQLNEMNQEAFTKALATIFEHSPWIPENAWEKRPFTNLSSLHQSMVEVVQTASKEQQLNLICAHPDLGTKAKMAEASVKEQEGVGLDKLTPEEYQRFHSLNETYKEQFGFPFIIAVKNHTKDSILTAFEQRIKNSPEVELEQALSEIFQIAKFRLNDLISV